MHASTLNLGSGDDTVRVKGGIVTGSYIDGGTGNDVLVLDNVTSNQFSFVRNKHKDVEIAKVVDNQSLRVSDLWLKNIEFVKLKDKEISLRGSSYGLSSSSETKEGEDITFTITRSGNTSSEGSVRFFTENGTAGADDFEAVDQVVKFAAGETSKEVKVKTHIDINTEKTEDLLPGK